MKRFFVVFFVLLFCLSLPSFALEFDNSWVEGGDTYLGKFHVKDLSAQDLSTWKSFMTAERLFAEQDRNHKIYFFTVPDGVTGKIVRNPPGSSFDFNIVLPPISTDVMVFRYSESTQMYEMESNYHSSSFIGFGLDAIIINRGFDLTSNVPSSELYIPKTGNLYIVDDLGNEMEGGDQGGASDDSWWRKLLDWLGSFWKKLKDFFVPEDDYFSDWFNEIKDAAMKKLGPISEIFDCFNGAFESLKNDNSNTGIYFDVPANHFFPGSSGMRFDMLKSVGMIIGTVKTLLTMVCVVFAAICCYKRIIVLFEQ